MECSENLLEPVLERRVAEVETGVA